ncbi:UNVERIFIED_CONTAM: hypothetical protein GTU68_050779 [Idotea baltica]|nr:hypothetical protein [Idotea baltica]
MREVFLIKSEDQGFRWLSAEPVYTGAERARRDQTVWTLVQGILAPIQFAVFLVSLVLVVKALMTGEGYALATASIVIKTLFLYAIMITGSIWENVVFGKFLFAKSFFWEDMVSMVVLALHTAYLIALYADLLSPGALLWLALAAYATYIVNAAQFILKLRAARLQMSQTRSHNSESVEPLRSGERFKSLGEATT